MNSALSFCTALRSRAIRIAGLHGLTVLFAFGMGRGLSAEDMAGQYLAGLRERGWHDVVLDYLDHAADDPLASPEFLNRLEYEQAATLAALAKESVRESERLELTKRAIGLFQKYADSHRDEPLYFEATSKVVSLLSEQALGKLAKANRLPADASIERTKLRTEARAGIDSANQAVEQLLTACKEKLASLPQGALARQNPDAPITRQQLTAKQAESRFLQANLLFEKAKTYSSSSESFNETLTAASEAFAKLYKDYSDKLVGFYGRLYEGRCYQRLGKLEEALDCYADLVDQPISNADFRRLVARAYRRRVECHMVAENLDQAIQESRDWLNDSRGTELKQPEWLAVAFRLAEAYRQKAATADASEASRLRAEARQLFREVSRVPGEFQTEARAALASGNNTKAAPAKVKSFDEAFTNAKDAVERMNSSKLAARLAAENNPDSVDELKQQAKFHQTEALRLFQTALRLADDDAEFDDLLETRFYLCWMYWESQLLYEAAVMGEYLALRYPESSYALSAAKVALAAHEKLYQQAKFAGEDGKYEAEQLGSLASAVAELWPESSEAGTAVSLLIQIALGDDRLEEAEQLLRQLPPSSRGPAKLNLGSALWTRYLRLTATNTGEISPAVMQLKQQADQLLSSGYDTLAETKNPSLQIATGVLYHVQLLLAQGEFDRAVKVLENRSVGPLAIIDQGNAQPAFAQEAYKAALRAYISVNPPQREQAQAMMTALEQQLDLSQNAQQLTRIYLGLGRQLQHQISELSNDGQTAAAQDVAAAFEDLLQRITSRGDSHDWQVRNWIAQSNLQLGEGLRGELARPYLEQAEEIYGEILADVEKDSNYAPSEIAVLGVRKRQGDCLRALGKYDQAFQQYASILREKPSMLEIQRTAALMLQQWGEEQKQAGKLEEAIRGALPQANNKNLVWGWLRLANIANQVKQKAEAADSPDPQKVQKYHDLYFEARYHVAKSRLLAAQVAPGTERTKQLNSARKNVESMKRLFPGLGGPRWQQAFDELLEQIEAVASE